MAPPHTPKKGKEMKVRKRNGKLEPVSFDKILNRLRKLSADLDIDVVGLAKRVIDRLADEIETEKLDEFAAQICSSMVVSHPHWDTLATRITVDNLHKNTSPSFSETIELLHSNKTDAGGAFALVSDELYDVVTKNKAKLNKVIKYDRDYLYDYFGISTLLAMSYLFKVKGKVVERPQHMHMRVALGIHGADVNAAIETYNLTSTKWFTHASPTLFAAGSPRPQLSSCFLVYNKADSITGIFQTVSETAELSKYGGGIGLDGTNIRANGSVIKGTNGVSKGIVPALRVLNETARYVDQGGGKRKGAFALYIAPWHADIHDVLNLRKTSGDMAMRTLDLHQALWVDDVLVQRVNDDGPYSLFCPADVPDLIELYGDAFRARYEAYEATPGLARQVVRARDLWKTITLSQVETGEPYILYKDHVNRKSNQKNVGTIKSSNLCVAPETMVLTETGYHPIASLVDTDVDVWNGETFSRTTVHQTGTDQLLLTVTCDNGTELRCTPYHKFFVETGKDTKSSNVIVVEAKDLTVGMRLARFDVPTINLPEPDEPMKYPYTQGLFAADGTYMTTSEGDHRCEYKQNDEVDAPFCKYHSDSTATYDDDGSMCCAEIIANKPMLWLYGDKKALREHVTWRYANDHPAADRLDLALPYDVEPKYFVPINHDIAAKLRWLEGYLDGDGCVLENNGIKNIQVASVHKDFFIQVKYLLQTLGVNVNIKKARDAGRLPMPDGRGGLKDYDCKTVWRFNIDCISVSHLVDLGFAPKRLVLGTLRKPKNPNNRFIKISGIVDKGERSDTFCFNEPLKHAGIFNGILSHNCSEVVLHTSPEETAVCTLASIALPTFVQPDGSFNFKELARISGVVTKNLNKIIDLNFYPVEPARKSNLRHRPIGIGVQGLANVFTRLRLPYDSPEAADLNRRIFAALYYGALSASVDLAKKEGPYETYAGSPASEGQLQFDLWGAAPETCDGLLDWVALKARIAQHGLRNSMLVALMPTASTSNILGFTESFEPVTSMFYTRRTLAGEFAIVNRDLVDALMDLGLWTEDVRNAILRNNGSVQGVAGIPADLQAVFKTAWEIKLRTMVDMAADRGAYVCQSASQNVFLADGDHAKLFNMLLYAHQKGLKTAVYYTRTQPSVRTQAFTLPSAPSSSVQELQSAEPVLACSRDNPECTSCSG